MEGAKLRRLFTLGIIKPTSKQAAVMAQIAQAQKYQLQQEQEQEEN